MIDRPFAAAISATIPPGDPHSQERMEWCKDAADAIADVCFAHAEGNMFEICNGVRAAFEHAMRTLADGARRRN